MIEQVGSYDPIPNERDECLVALNFERIEYWLSEGTAASKPVARIFGNEYNFHSMTQSI